MTSAAPRRSAAGLGLAVLALLFWAVEGAPQTEVEMEIRSGEAFLIPILVEPMGTEGAVARGDLELLETSLRNDLNYTDMFFIFIGTRDGSWNTLTPEMDPRFLEQKPQAIVKSTLERGDDGKLVLRGVLEDFGKAKEIFSSPYEVEERMPTWACHAFCDDVTRYLTGESGVAQTRIAYISKNSQDADVMLVDWDGRRASRLTELTSIVVSPCWSPEGRRLAFTSFHTGAPTLVAVDINKANMWTISREEGLNTAPAWSPRGDRIAFTMTKHGNAEIYTARPTGQDVRRLTFSPGIDTAPSYDPSGRNMAFTSDRSGRPQLYLMSQDGADVRRLTFWGQWNDSPDWSPSGERIVYAGLSESSFDLFVIHPDGSGLRRLTKHPGDCENPRWAPDSRHVIYSRREGSERRLWVLDVETLRERSLTQKQNAAYNPAWSPTLSARSETAKWSQ